MKKITFIVLMFGVFLFAHSQEYRLNDNVEWLKGKLNSVCVKQMQIIAEAMFKYHNKNGKFPAKPSELKGYIEFPPYNADRAYLIFISPADTIDINDVDGWDYVDNNCSYILNDKANIDDWKDVLISEKRYFLWPDRKTYVFIGKHAATITDKGLEEIKKNGKL